MDAIEGGDGLSGPLTGTCQASPDENASGPLSGAARAARLGTSPDANAGGFLHAQPDPLRYDVDRPLDPDEVPGIVATMIPAGSRVLDVGCGTGTLACVLSAACSATFVGIEPDAARAERARSRGLEIHDGYLTQELIKELEPFDVVLFADVLEHLPNPQSLLLLAREALKPRGAAIVSVPNVAHWSVRSCLLRGKFDYQPFGIMDATHLRWFTAKTIASLLESAGFRVIEHRGTAGLGLPDNEARAPLRWLPPRQRERVLRKGSRRWPALFGTQHVARAEMK